MTEKRQSKKGTSDSGRLLIGEKGLGFLSVFKIAREIDVFSRPGPRTWKVHLTDDLIRSSIDTGEPIPVEDAGDFLTYGTRIYLRKLKKSFSVSKLYEYVSVAFAPLLTWQFRILVNGNEAIAPELPTGIMHERSGEEYSISLVDPYRVEDRKPVRFYNRGVLVKREVIARRPTLTGFVNTDLTLVTGRGAYVEDDQYHKFKKALDSLVDDIPDSPHYSNVLVQKSNLTKSDSLAESYKSYKAPRVNLPTLLFVIGIVLIASGFLIVVLSLIGGYPFTGMTYTTIGASLFVAGIIPIIITWKILS